MKPEKITPSIVVSIIALLISALTFLVQFFPQINVFSDDYIAKAEAGHVDSQIFLANHYFEIGDISNSVLWYDIASQKEGDHQARAINNLAYIYLTDDRISIAGRTEFDAMKMLHTSAKLGEIDGAKNLYILLISNPRELFGDDYDETLEFAKQILLTNGIALSDYEKFNTQWEYIETCIGESVPADNDTYKYVEIGMAKYELTENQFHWTHSYQVYRKPTNTLDPEYIYSKID